MIDSLITIAFCLSSVLTVVILLLPSQYVPPRSTTGQAEPEKPTVQILVLGDIGRSPRMQYHALSIARKGGKVVIIGYQGKFLFNSDCSFFSAFSELIDLSYASLIESDPNPDIVSNPNITIVPLRPHPAILQTSNKLLFTIFGPLKVLFQIACLWQCLAYTTAPARWIIVQVTQPSNMMRMTEACLLRVEPAVYSYTGSDVLILLPTANTTDHRLA